jgi:Subtilase family
MARNLEHFELPRWQEPLPRRKHGGGAASPNENRKAHGQELSTQVEKISDDLRQRKQQLPSFINPKLIFKLKLKGSIQEDALEKMGLNLLSQDAHRIIVVFPNGESLSELKARLEAFTSEKMRYDEFLVIEKIEPLVAEDRIGRRLKDAPLKENEIAPLDIELWHAGSRDECRIKINEIKNYLSSLSLSVTDEWIGERLCLMRAKVNLEAFRQIIEIDYVKEVDRRPTPTFEMGDLLLDLSDIQIESANREVSGLTGVLIIDSGVMQQHPLIKPVLGDAQVFPDKRNEQITGGAEDGDQRTGGHGTAVAGIAVYNHIGECIEKRIFEPHTQLFSARVTDGNNNYDEDALLEHQLNDAVEYFLKNYPAVKVINISLGNDGSVYSQGMYQFRFAAVIDELAYKHRDKEVVFVCSSGNFTPQELSDEEIKQQYP